MDSQKITDVYNLKKKREELQTQVDDLDKQIKDLDAQIDASLLVILGEMKADNKKEFAVDDLVATLMSKASFTISEDDVLKYLKDKGYTNLISIKEAVNKKELNKEVKINAALKKDLAPYMTTKSTEYVVVTTAENTEEMKKHINENKKSSSAIDTSK
jgi:hypothetical protein